MLRKPDLAGGKRLFVSFNPPHRPIGPATVGRWAKLTLCKAGVDTEKFSAHSTRAAAVSAAKTVIPIDQIVRKVGLASEAMFAKFYNNPIEDVRGVGEALLEIFTSSGT